MPSRVETVGVSGREASVIEKKGRLRAASFQFKFHDGVNAWAPMAGTPRLDDSLVGRQLDISAGDDSAEQRKCAAYLGVDLCRKARECGKLLWVQQRFIDALRTDLEVGLVMQSHAFWIGSRRRSRIRSRVLSRSKGIASHGQAA